MTSRSQRHTGRPCKGVPHNHHPPVQAIFTITVARQLGRQQG